jgi:hypothetical protein
LSLDSTILHYPATNKKKRREYNASTLYRDPPELRGGSRPLPSSIMHAGVFFLVEEKCNE